jgi:superfamily II DNA or RNA helicase
MVNYSWLLGLTATIERIDGLEAMLLERAPISGTITVKEALANGWISEMIHLNVPVFLTRKEMDAQVELNNTISRGLSIFGGDFQLMQQCQNVEKAKNYALNRYPHDDVDSRYKQIQVSAIDTSRRIRARKDFLINTKHKIDASVKLIQELGLKTILFSESTLFATDIATLVGPSAVDYHTNVAPRERAVEKLKVCKTEKAVLKFLEEHPNSKARPYVNEKGKTNWGIRYFENKILSSANAKKNNMLRFKDNEVSVICTARALDVGFDCDSVEFGLEASRTTSTAQARQRKGRVCRTYTYSDGSEKIGIYISLYVPNTQDEKWLRASQVGMSESVIWIDDVEEAISLIKSSLKAKRIEAKP